MNRVDKWAKDLFSRIREPKQSSVLCDMAALNKDRTVRIEAKKDGLDVIRFGSVVDWILDTAAYDGVELTNIEDLF